ncbi:hypothetical protein [Nocardia sp. alder85J]|uniref:hypothetical protein n=1 Tax=Nocardia sp. alder85J TaxID=2862949 RepID=UPI001CD796E3|nr:hypothetical protein [Nocardia sp. alder85J]MCX4092320.1 hypothetical protein [Nocardia sp. alder85J]
MDIVPSARRHPLRPVDDTFGWDLNPNCGHRAAEWCAGCDACTICDGECYCSGAVDEPWYLLAG